MIWAESRSRSDLMDWQRKDDWGGVQCEEQVVIAVVQRDPGSELRRILEKASPGDDV